MKFKALLLSILLSVALLAGCGTDEPVEETTNNEETTDATTTASLVAEEDAFKEAISADGTWIIATLNDLTFEEELVLEGEFHDKGDDANDLYRKIAPYTQDEDHNVTERFTVTAPKLTIKSPNAKFQAGTFVGDIMVEANGFVLKDAKVEGNVYFASEEYKESFTNEESEVTGEIAVQEASADATTTASLVAEEDAFKSAISADGTWIIATLDDLSFDEELVLEGEFYDKDDESSDLYRKIGLYEQDEDRNVTARYSLTAPKLTIKSPNAKIQSGTFVGDIYVEAEGFKLADTKVEGNVYFANEEYKESFEQDEKSEVTGEVAVQE